jgi:hypothetical protein
MSWDLLAAFSLPCIGSLSVFGTIKWLLRRKDERLQVSWTAHCPPTTRWQPTVYQSPAAFWAERNGARYAPRAFKALVPAACELPPGPAPIRAPQVASHRRSHIRAAPPSTGGCRVTWMAQGRCWECGSRPVLGEYRCVRCNSHN